MTMESIFNSIEVRPSHGMEFLVFTDPGHAWVRVPKSLAHDLGIEGRVSSYSYQDSEFLYLEEDCDALLFINALNDWGYVPEFKDIYSEDCFVRELPSV